jgi:hypothetical protein
MSTASNRQQTVTQRGGHSGWEGRHVVQDHREAPAREGACRTLVDALRENAEALPDRGCFELPEMYRG